MCVFHMSSAHVRLLLMFALSCTWTEILKSFCIEDFLHFEILTVIELNWQWSCVLSVGSNGCLIIRMCNSFKFESWKTVPSNGRCHIYLCEAALPNCSSVFQRISLNSPVRCSSLALFPPSATNDMNSVETCCLDTAVAAKVEVCNCHWSFVAAICMARKKFI